MYTAHWDALHKARQVQTEVEDLFVQGARKASQSPTFWRRHLQRGWIKLCEADWPRQESQVSRRVLSFPASQQICDILSGGAQRSEFVLSIAVHPGQYD